MDTAALDRNRKANYQNHFFPLLVFTFGFAVLTSVSGCFDSSTDDTPPAVVESKTSSELPSIHTDSVSDVLHAPGKYAPYTNRCTACHGQTLQGGTGPSCNNCHGQVWSETTPPSGGTGTGSANVPSNHTDNVNTFLHAPGKDTPYSSWCTACHGQNLGGDLGPSCNACHGQVWTETSPPNSGGSTSNPPSNHTDNVNGFLHAAGKDTPYSNFCTVCHGSTLEGDLDRGAPSCTTCHAQVWTETSPPAGGGGSSTLPSNHTDNVNSFLHASGKDTPYSSFCTACHGSALEGNATLGAPSCTTCHGQVWTETAPPSGGGGTSNPPSNHTDNVQGFLHAAGKDTPYSNFCTACHGASLEGDVNSGAPSCTTCHGQVWTETAPPSGGGGSNPPSNHTNDISGFLHAPGNQTPYSSWCTACHGADLGGDINLGAPSCTTCHGQIWTETTPPSGGGGSTPPSNHTNDISGFLHAPGNNTPYSSWCTACHGADLTGNPDLGAPSCTACHSELWTETTPPSGGGGSTPPANHTDNVSGFLHAAGKTTPYSSWCTACHGAALEGDISQGIPSCTACHTQVWTETAPPSGGGGSNPPSNHTDDVNGFLHGVGKDAPYSSWCTACHGDTLQGNVDLGAPSCTACHGQVWTEAPPSGGGSSSNPPSNHTDNQNGFLHAAGKTTPYSSWCTVCHGDSLQGDLNAGIPSCTACHSQVWTETAPPSGGGGSNPPSNHTNNIGGYFHAPGNNTPFSSWCTVCHGANLQGDLDSGAPSCTACHGQLWTETTPPSGGGSSNPPSNHTDSQSGFLHAPGKQTPYSSWCTACHGSSLQGNLDLGAPSCTACHSQVWSETTPPSGGGSGTPPSNHTDSQNGFLHAPGKQTPYSSWCTACHGSSLQGNLDLGAPSCTACHGQVWSESSPPGGGSGSLPSSHTNNISGFMHAPGNETPYSSWCTVCHGSSLQGDLSIGAPPCTACHTVLWSETGGGPTGNPPDNHTDSISGFLHAPGAERPYSNWCWGCHGSNLQGNSSLGAPPCTVCHTAQWSETSSAARRLPADHTDSQGGFRHGPGKNAPYTNMCTVCHGATLRGNSTLGTPSCYQCHGQEWSESGGGGGGD